MELTVKHFRELTAEELYDIYRLRAAVFVVEQNCVYQDVDDADKTAYHLWLSDEDGIQVGQPNSGGRNPDGEGEISGETHCY